ncbi:hypothetical protein ACFFP0_25320 [Rhizobium puerariae]|uniref:Uncharacterized protein n=1 Tax=Rhizobium puerariae TaxID=1585791 RepID=A0ABV6AS77_9HYPH
MSLDDESEMEYAKAAIPLLMKERKQLLHDLTYHEDGPVDHELLNKLLKVVEAISMVEAIARGKPEDPYLKRGIIGFPES